MVAPDPISFDRFQVRRVRMAWRYVNGKEVAVTIAFDLLLVAIMPVLAVEFFRPAVDHATLLLAGTLLVCGKLSVLANLGESKKSRGSAFLFVALLLTFETMIFLAAAWDPPIWFVTVWLVVCLIVTAALTRETAKRAKANRTPPYGEGDSVRLAPEQVRLTLMAVTSAAPIWWSSSCCSAMHMVAIDQLPLSADLKYRLRGWASRYDSLVQLSRGSDNSEPDPVLRTRLVW